MTEEDWIRNELLRKYCGLHKKDRVGAFATFEGFSQWAMGAGFLPGSNMLRYDTSKPISPENSYFAESPWVAPFHGKEKDEFICRWHKTINVIRKHFGLPPLPAPEFDKVKPSDQMLVVPVNKKTLVAIASGDQKENYREIKPYWTGRLEALFATGEMQCIRFRSGNRRDEPYAECMVSLKVGKGKPYWGAEPGKSYYILGIKKVCRVSIPEDWDI